MKLSARNVLPATVKSVKPGAVDSEVIVELAPGSRPSPSSPSNRLKSGLRSRRQGLRDHQGIQRHDRRRLMRALIVAFAAFVQLAGAQTPTAQIDPVQDLQAAPRCRALHHPVERRKARRVSR